MNPTYQTSRPLLSWLTCLALLAHLPALRAQSANADILIQDFEAADYGGWKVEG